MKQISLRLPEELHAALKVLARKEDRSLHAQIIRILRQANDNPHTTSSETGSGQA
ncbi:FitA-like ribbon-helix-helix domain-containing protein [Nocardiopsis ganjiahuensis]|uniref:FitA-like ribbon-helix-helix domain-containing protein n=1 Tax=Nocardiopsis ganjiahuensis TaxID=239984 RepID=UPI00126801DE|nr:Arc family DNA-binding protein [Nocardiopsis ganjiahuensis]